MFIMTQEKIMPQELYKLFDNPKAGAFITFEGRVRNHNDGKSVSSLEYQSYSAMALKEGSKIIAQAKEKFGLIDAYCVHAEGHLQVGDLAIWIVTLAKHRKEAYLASEYIIDTVKQTVPIWKREHYLNETPNWVACHRCQGNEKENALHV